MHGYLENRTQGQEKANNLKYFGFRHKLQPKALLPSQILYAK